jgi:uncharacterized membrane protein YphA (DoxX/SURF4 family)
VFARIIYGCQFFYGGWFVFHGLNYWFAFYYDPTIRPGPGLIPALVAAGVMTIVKVLEVVIGAALLTDFFATLAIVAAWPITIMIAYVNASHLKSFGICVGIIIISLNAAMSFGHLDRYRSMLVPSAGPPTTAGLLGRPGGLTARIPLLRHILAIVVGIAAPIAVTYLTVLMLRH